MPAEAGRDVLISIATAAAPTVFVALGGIRAKSITLNNTTIDVTNQSSAGQFRELLSGAGIRSAELSGSGAFIDDASDGHVQKHFVDRTLAQCRFTIPNFFTITGPFAVTSIEYAGDHDGEATFNYSFVSGGALIFATIP